MSPADGSIASDSGACPLSRLSPNLQQDTRLRLVNKFLLFYEDREKIRRRMESYVLDFQLHDSGAAHRYEELEEQYATDAPNLNHIILREGGEVLWSARDIAIVLGRNASNVARTFQRMRAHPVFGVRLSSLSVTQENPGRDAATLYVAEIFDAIVDFFESAYLERITHPRHGTPLSDEERAEVLAFWRAMKAAQDDAEVREYGRSLSLQTGEGFSTIYPCLRMIVKRALSVKMGTLLLLLFAVVYELSRRYPLFNILIPILSVAVLFTVLFAMPKRKWYTPWLLDAGACAVTFGLLWMLAVIATPDSPVQRLLPQFPIVLENGTPEERPQRGEIPETKIVPSDARPDVQDVQLECYGFGMNGDTLNIRIATKHPAKEIFYRTTPSGDFRLTGFLKESDMDDRRPPLPYVEVRCQPNTAIDVKYVDMHGREHGPYSFNFSLRDESVKAAREILSLVDWIQFSSDENVTSAFLHVALLIDSWLRDRAISRFMYGINTHTPDIERKVEAHKPERGGDHLRNLANHILFETREKIWFVSAQFFFADGTATDVRIFDNPYASLYDQ